LPPVELTGSKLLSGTVGRLSGTVGRVSVPPVAASSRTSGLRLRAFPDGPCRPGLRPTAPCTVVSRRNVADKVGARHRPRPMVYIGTNALSGSGRQRPPGVMISVKRRAGARRPSMPIALRGRFAASLRSFGAVNERASIRSSLCAPRVRPLQRRHPAPRRAKCASPHDPDQSAPAASGL